MLSSYWILFLFGIAIGSFLNVCIHRLPLDQSLWSPPSHCPACRQRIRWRDNIPLLSFLWLGGKCRDCKAPISRRYPLVELLNGLGYVLLVWKIGLTWPALVYALLFSALLVVTFIDLQYQIIPNEITFPGMALGILAGTLVLPQGFWSSLTGLLLGGGLFYLVAVLSERVLKREGMGGGDIKLIAMIGAFLGWQNVLLTIFIGALLGSVMGVLLILLAGRGRREPIPFGPFLSVAAMTALFWGDQILYWYLSGAFWR